MKDLYDILNITRNVNQSEIKKAYRKLALKFHPDRNKENKEEAEKKFKEISEAYEILSNEEKKKIYDRHGYEAVKEGLGGGMHSQHDIFENLFGGRGMHRQEENRDNDIKEILEIDLIDAYIGRSIKKVIEYKKLCTKSKDNKVKICEKCNGRGVYVRIQQMGPMIQQMQMTCPDCGGKGKINNNKFKIEKENIEINIKKGIKNEELIKLDRKGHEDDLGIRGNLIYMVKIKEDNKYTRKDNDLYLENYEINLFECLVGTVLNIDFIDKKKKKIVIEQLIDGKRLYRVPNLGMPYEDGAAYGDLYIDFDIIYPEYVDQGDETCKILSEILHQKKRKIIYNDTKEYNLYIAEHNENNSSDDEENGHPHGERVQCAQQ